MVGLAASSHADAMLAFMPAVGYRMPDGLSWEELETILNAAMRSGRAAGIDITIFEPPLDRNGTIARELVNTLARGLVRSPDARLELCATRQRRMGLGFQLAHHA